MKNVKKNRGFLLFGLMLAFSIASLTSCSKQAAIPADNEIIAEWKDSAWTVAQFKDKMLIRHRNEATAEKQPYQERMNILTEYVVRELKLAEGKRLGFDKRPDILKQYNEALERYAVDILYKEKVRDKFVTEQMLRDYYEHDRWEVRVRHILIAMDPTVTGKDTLYFWERIKEVWDKAKKGDDFARLVDVYSEDNSIDRKFRGDLGFFRWGRMVDEFQEAAWALEPGEISNIVRTKYGYHVLQSIAKRPNGYQVRTSQILVSVTRRADPAESTAAWERAITILNEAKKPGADFAQLARRYSEDKNSWVNGDLGWLPRGSMPSEYWELALGMQVGEIGGPVRTYQGYHIIKVTDSRVDWKPLEDPEMRDMMYSRLESMYRTEMQEASEAFVDSITKAHNMRYNDKTMNIVVKKLSTPDLPSNMNAFSLLTAEERAMNIIDDDLGGIPVDTLVQMYGDHRFPPKVDDGDYVKAIQGMLQPMLIPRYLVAVAKAEGYTKRPDVIKEGRRALDNAILPEIEKEMIFNRNTPDNAEVEKHFKDNISKYTEAATMTVYEIMVDDKKLAEDLLDRVKKGENISVLARRFTMREKAKRSGGRLGPFTIDQYSNVSREAFKLQVGQLSDIIQMGNTYSIVQVIEKTDERVKSLEEVRAEIESDLRFTKQKQMQDAWNAELRKAYNLKIHEDKLKNVWPLHEQLPEAMVAERDKWKEERKLIAENAKRKAEEDRIRLRLQPNTEQTFRQGDKEIKVKIGEPRYVDKDGNEAKQAESGGLKVTPKGRVDSKSQSQSKEGETKKSSLKIEQVTPSKR